MLKMDLHSWINQPLLALKMEYHQRRIMRGFEGPSPPGSLKGTKKKKREGKDREKKKGWKKGKKEKRQEGANKEKR